MSSSERTGGGERGARSDPDDEADTVYAALTSHVETTEATLEVESYHYPELDDDLQATVTLGDLEVSIGLTPEEAAILRDDLTDALADLAVDEVDP